MNAPNTVKYPIDPSNPPPMTTEQTQRLAAIAARPDADIDYSDIPRQTGAVAWTRTDPNLSKP